MEATIARLLKGLGFSLILYAGMWWLDLNHGKVQVLALIPFFVSITGILVREVYAIATLVFLLGIINFSFDGRPMKQFLNIARSFMTPSSETEKAAPLPPPPKPPGGSSPVTPQQPEPR